MSSESPDLGELLYELAAAIKGSMTTAIPATVVTYDPVRQVVTAKPTVAGRFHEPESDTLIPAPLPTVANVPVAFPSGGGCSITWPLVPGDTVLLVVADRSLDEWKSTGAPENLPQDIRRFDLTDAIAIPSVKPLSAPIPPSGIFATAMVLAGADIRLGSSAASDFVALASRVLVELEKLRAVYNAHTHVSATPGSPTAVPVAQMAAVGSVAATKVKAE